jgi:hypothetical protein
MTNHDPPKPDEASASPRDPVRDGPVPPLHLEPLARGELDPVRRADAPPSPRDPVPPLHLEQLARGEIDPVHRAAATPSPRDPVPPLHLEQLARGELDPVRRAAVLARLGPDADARLAALAASDRDILAAHPPAATAAAIQRRLAARRAPRPRLWLAAPALAGAAVLFLVLRPGPEVDEPLPISPAPPAPVDPPDGVRIKGLEPRLVVHRQQGDVAVELTTPASARPRDVLQVSYIAAGAAHGVIVSLDGNGVVTLHHPAGVADATALRQDGAVRLPQAYELDDAPRFERFVFVTADAPLAVDAVLTAARTVAAGPDPARAPLVVPAGARQTSFLVDKADR